MMWWTRERWKILFPCKARNGGATRDLATNVTSLKMMFYYGAQ